MDNNETNILDIIDTDSRFVMNKGEVTFLTSDGNIINNAKEYFEKRKLDNITYFDKLKVGDIVKLKGVVEETVIVKYVEYKFNDQIKADYAGIPYNTDEERLILFGQDDIDEVYTNSPNKTL